MELRGTFDQIEYEHVIIITRENTEIVESCLDGENFMINLYVDETFYNVLKSCIGGLAFKGVQFWDNSKWIAMSINCIEKLHDPDNAWPINEINQIVLHTNNSKIAAKIKLCQ